MQNNIDIYASKLKQMPRRIPKTVLLIFFFFFLLFVFLFIIYFVS